MIIREVSMAHLLSLRNKIVNPDPVDEYLRNHPDIKFFESGITFSLKEIEDEIFRRIKNPPDTSKYSKRTEEEHNAIRGWIKVNPKNCCHLKGNEFGRLNAQDFNVSKHTFIDGSQKIKCNTCRKVWTPEDADWKDAVKMTETSTNFQSCSEIPLRKDK